MGAIRNFLMLAVIMQIGMMLFIGQGTDSVSSLTDLVLTPSQWFNSPLLSYFNAAIFAFGITGVVVGLYLIRNEWIVYAGIGSVFISQIFPIITFIGYMGGTLNPIMGGAGYLIGALIAIPVLIGFVITILDFTRGRD